MTSSIDRSIFDIHVHLWGEPSIDEEFLSFAEEWEMPFAVSCLGPYGSFIMHPSMDECRKSNDLVLALMERKPGFVHGFCYIDPVHGKQAIKEMRRCLVDNNMVGVKLWVGCRCSDERAFPIVEEAISLNVPVLQHAFMRLTENLPGESYPSDVAALAARYPEARIIMAHMGFDWKKGIAEVKDYPNILVDTSGADPEAGSVEYAVSELGVGRVLYGSDAPGRDALCQIGRVAAARISDEERESIFRRNAEELLGGRRR